MPTKLGKGGHGPELYDATTGEFTDEETAKENERFQHIPTLVNFKKHREDAIKNAEPRKRLSQGLIDYANIKLKRMLAGTMIGSHVKLKDLISVLTNGLQNQFETHQSGGVYDPEKRLKATQDMFGTDISTWETDGPSFEKYGCVRDKRSQLSGYDGEWYGSVYVSLKDDIKNKTTICIADSIDDGPTFPVLWGEDFDQFAFPDYMRDSLIDKGFFGSLSIDDATNVMGTAYMECQIHDRLTARDIDTVYISTSDLQSLDKNTIMSAAKLSKKSGFSIKIVPEGLTFNDAVDLFDIFR